MRRGFLFFLLLCATPLFLFGCGERPRDRQALVRQLSAEPDLLNPILSLDAYASMIEGFLFDSLLERDPATLAFRPKIAKRYELSDDHLSFTFHLRHDVKWHDGTPLTAEDVRYSYERIQDPEVTAPHLRVYYQDVEDVKVLDEYTVRFVFKRPYFLALEFCAGLPILPRHLHGTGKAFNENPLNRAPVGSGPYRFLKWETGKRIILTRNEDYYDVKPAIMKMEFKVMADSAVALLALKKGLIDFLGLQPIQWMRETQSEGFNRRFVKHEYYTPGYQFIAWNMKDPLFADKRVREAMSAFIDCKALIDKLNFGLGTAITGPFFFLSEDYDAGIPAIAYDPERGKALLREAGWEDHDRDGWLDKDGVKFHFTFLLSASSSSRERMATILKENLRRVGIDMEIEQMEWAVFLEKINKRDFEATTLGWSMGFETDPYQVWHSSQVKAGSNFVGFENPEVDRLIEEARLEFDVGKRRARFHRIHRIIHDEAPYTFLFSSPTLIARDRRFDNVRIYKGGIDMLEWTVKAE